MRKVLMVLMALALVAVLPAQSLAQGYLVSYALHSQGRNVSLQEITADELAETHGAISPAVLAGAAIVGLLISRGCSAEVKHETKPDGSSSTTVCVGKCR